MPKAFKIDSLSRGTDLIKNLVVEDIDWGGKDVIKVSNEDCITIPFCGYLTFEHDTIFHSAKITESRKPFLIFNIKKFSEWSVEYSPNRIDRVTYMGSMFDKLEGDSLYLFMLNPIKGSIIHTGYLKFIAINNGGIRLLSFSNHKDNFFTIKLDQYPKVVYEE